MADEKPVRTSNTESAAPQGVKLPPEPAFEKDHKLNQQEHKRAPKRQGRFRPLKDIGEPTGVEEPRK
jgi:hypothetical protein